MTDLSQASPRVRAVAEGTRRAATLTATTSAVNLAVGEPDLPTPRPVVEAMVDALRSGHTRYVSFDGDPRLREALARHLTRTHGTSISSEDVLVTHGATAGLAATIGALVGDGQRVVVPDPSYSLYADVIRLAGGVPVPVPTTRDHHLDVDATVRALRGARALVYCSPCNPTGAVYRRDDLTEIARSLRGTDTIVIADEAYSSILFPGTELTSVLDLDDLRGRAVYCQTFSKAYAMTGLRLGYVVAPPDLLGPVATLHRTFNGSLNGAAQRAAQAALELDPAITAPMQDAYVRRRQLVLDELATMPQVEVTAPEGAFYAFPRITLDIPSTEVAALLHKAGLKVRAGREFGAHGEHHLRLSFAAADDDISAGLAILRSTLTDMAERGPRYTSS